MGNFVDFEAIKASVNFEQAIGLLQLEMKRAGNQWRGVCPQCKGGDRGLVVTEGRGAYCFSASKGGDQIWLVAHVMGTDVKAAAKLLAGGINSSSTVPQAKQTSGASEGGFKPLEYLEHQHEAIVAMGFNTDLCKELGIGYAGKGILRGTVAIPIRDEHGVLRGYVGATDLTLPPSFMANVVPFEKKKA